MAKLTKESFIESLKEMIILELTNGQLQKMKESQIKMNGMYYNQLLQT